MADEGRPEDEAPSPKPKRRRRPPTLDLTAKEVKAEEKARQTRKEAPRAESGAAASASSWNETWERAAGGDWRSIPPAPVLTGVIGVLAGALVVYLLMPRSEGADPRVGQLTQEIATLSARIETLAARPAPAADPAGLGARIDRLTAAIGEAEQRLAAVEKRPEPKAPDLSSVNQRTAAIEGTLKELRSGLSDLKRIAEEAPEASSQAADKLAGRIGGLEDRIAALTAARAAQPTNADLAAAVVSLNALGTALRAGQPFAKELDAARSQLGEQAAKLAPLAPFAAAGLPTVEALEKQFAELAPKILSGPEPNGNFFERLTTNASRLVQVRPVGEPAGNSVGAIVARAETKLGRRDLSGAIGEIESLPEAEKALAAKWLAAARQRRDAEALLQNLAEASLLQAREAARP